MRVKPAQLKQQVQKGLAAAYFLTGDEPLQLMECSDFLRQVARKQGFTERTVLHVEANFDWSVLQEATQTFSLFASKKLIEIRLGNKTIPEAGTKLLTAFFSHTTENTCLLILADKLDAAKQKTKWFALLEEKAIIVPIMPLELAELPAWIQQRLQAQHLSATPDALALIAERAEGHLLACAQEIEKLGLLYPPHHVLEVQEVLDAVTDSARFEIFAWVDVVLSGDVARSVRQLRGLRAEGLEPILIAWALDREIRTLAQASYALHQKQSIDYVCKTYRIWQQRKTLVLQAIKRHPATTWQNFLAQSLEIDRLVKGMSKGNVWDALQKLAVQVAGGKFLE
jgi:DNA polymerase-3 subunit delta